uniref:Uncharacterized protein n=1 Tax=Panagrolaimus sp. PS1159 TaxID=55785 RepID=A0AC35GGR4_9BILA
MKKIGDIKTGGEAVAKAEDLMQEGNYGVLNSVLEIAEKLIARESVKCDTNPQKVCESL